MRSSKLALALLGSLTLCTAASAAEPPAAQTTISTSSGMKVGIDPATGKLRPLTAAESRKLDLSSSRTRGQHVVTQQQALASKRQLRGGGTAMKLPTELMSTVTATTNADGTVSIHHAGDVSTGAPNE